MDDASCGTAYRRCRDRRRSLATAGYADLSGSDGLPCTMDGLLLCRRAHDRQHVCPLGRVRAGLWQKTDPKPYISGVRQQYHVFIQQFEKEGTHTPMSFHWLDNIMS